ncbi:carbon monoxide dehydrogenase [Anaerolineae bacterium]|nr:6-hydroxypseudooxynicotine dehydrogenase complex subunit alpha [Anaerolineaceae bacterium]GBL37430.1 6-hydroxypseudooxynicotine dehydrogenase complex subunit alpha [Anaerolineaceae bacterium]GDX68488.1 carbon monoxide dehydrogenase [Anaerolineae bacterium]
MKPAPFVYHAPTSLGAALMLKAEHGDEAKFLAGGQSLIPAMNFRIANPALLVDVNKLAALDYIHVVAGELRIGALTRVQRLEHDPLVRAHWPLLPETVPHIAHPQIRNRSTVGGSLAHADPAAELPVILTALGGRLRLQSSTGERWVGADDFFVSLFTTAIATDEMLVEVAIPAAPARTGTAFMEVARRHGDYAMLGVAVVVTLDAAGACSAARLIFLNAGDRPMNAQRAAAALLGQLPGSAAIEAAASSATEELEPMGSVHATPAYQRHLARVLARRALRLAVQRAN